MDKFIRNYKLTVLTNDDQELVIEPPFTIEFDVIRNFMTSANTCSFAIYNLSQSHRFAIQKNMSDWGNLRWVRLEAGYGQDMPLIFTGNISEANSVREGPNFVTRMEAFDGGQCFLNSRINIPFPSGSDRKVIADALIDQLGEFGIKRGAVGNSLQGTTPRGNSFNGPTVELLSEYTGGQFFIDNGRAYIISMDECLPDDGITTINASSGLLGTPRREETNMTLDMIFEPKLRIGQQVSVESVTEKWMNGQYKVVSLHHRATISETVCGDAITTVGLLAPFLGIKLTTITEER